MLQTEQVLQNRYRLDRKLGQNAGRQTWLARDLQLDEVVVVKLLTFGGHVQWDDLKLFEREAQVLQQLNHPRIPKCRDYFSIDRKALWFGLVQEYIPGESLKDLLVQGKKFSQEQICQIAREVLQILIYLHELSPPVLHRDIKPSNLIWGEDGQIYLVDFGAVQDKAIAEGRTLTLVGTYGYAPMEQFGGRAVPASDLYALGATLIHLLTGISPAELPHDGMRVEFRDRTNITNAAPELIKWLEILTDPSVKQRPSNARQALELLDEPFGFHLPNLGFLRLIDSKVKVLRSADALHIHLPSKQKSWLDWIAIFLGIAILSSLALTSWSSAIHHAIAAISRLAIADGAGIVALLIGLLLIGVGTGLLVPLLAILENYFAQQRILFDYASFAIESRLLGICRRHCQEKISHICIVWRGTIIQNRQEKEAMFIETLLGDRYAFAKGLTHAECMWIEREIKSWLHMK